MVTQQLKKRGVCRRMVAGLHHTITDLLLNTLRRGRGRFGVLSQQPGHRDAKEKDAAQFHVRLLDPPSRLPVTPLEQLMVITLQAQGPTLFPALVERGAQALYRDALRHGTWAVDIGLFGSGLFTGDVTRELQAGDGILWQIKECKDPVA